MCPHDGMFLMREPTLLKAGATGENLYYKVQDILYDDTFALYTASPEVISISIQTLGITIDFFLDLLLLLEEASNYFVVWTLSQMPS